MKNNKGFFDVFSFTFIQTFKSKMIIAVTVIMCILAFVSIPIINSKMVSGDNGGNSGKSAVKKVLICDASGIGLADSIDIFKDDKFTKTKFESVAYGVKEAKKAVKNTDNVYLAVYINESIINFEYIYDGNKNLSSSDVDELSSHIESKMPEIERKAFGITDEQQKIISKDINVKKQVIGQKKSDGINSNLMLAYICILVFALALCGESISTSVAMEKSTRVIEYLTINVKPIVLIMGKIIAMTCVLFTQIISALICFIISSQVYGDAGTKKAVYKWISESENVSISTAGVLLSIVLFVCGILVFGMMAGLAGAAVSRVEALGESMKIYSIILIVGAYGAMFLTNSGQINELTPVTIGAFIFPVTALFVAPVYAVFGKISLAIIAVSALVMAVTAVLLIIFVSRVYEGMIYYSGETLKLKDIICFSKNKIKEEKDV